MRFFSLLILGLSLLVTGCQTAPPAGDPDALREYQLQQIETDFWITIDKGHHQQAVKIFEQQLGSDYERKRLKGWTWQEELAKLFICDAYYKVRNYGKFFGCVDRLEKEIETLEYTPEKNMMIQILLRDNESSVRGLSRKLFLQSQVLSLLAKGNLDLGHYDKAQKYSEQALDKVVGNDFENAFSGAKRAVWHKAVVEGYRLAALSNIFIGDIAKARQHLKNLEAITISVAGDHAYKKRKHIALAQINMALEQYQEALEVLNRYDNQSPSVFLVAVGFLGDPMLVVGTGIEVALLADEAATADDINKFVAVNLPKSVMLAKAQYGSGNTAEARKIYDLLLGNVILPNFSGMYYLVLHERALIAFEDKDDELAVRLLKKAVEVIESQRSTIDTEASKIGFVGDKQAVYGLLVSALVAQKKDSEAFVYAERGKARAMVDILAEKRSFKGGKTGSADNVALMEKLAAAEQAGLTDLVERVQGKVQTRSVSGVQQQLILSSPELASLVVVQPPDVRKIRKRLAKNEVLIEYFGQREELFAFIVSNKDVQAVVLNGKGLLQAVERFRKAVSDPDSSDYKTEGKALYDRIVRPLANHLRGKTITIVPHGPLHYVSFAALHNGKQYFIDQAALRIMPSAAVMEYLKNDRRVSQPKMLALGNPDLKDANMDLPGAEKETRALMKLVKGSRVLLRQQASESAAKEYAEDFDYIHFASHGVFDNNKPLNSGLLLAADNANDGVLTVSELYDMRINADLVTLSACETGLGKNASGDELVGLTRAFLFAGADTIVSSLWAVEDNATAKLMQSFYRQLGKQNKREALRFAQMKVRDEYNSHPVFWAPFQLTGAIN